MAEIDRPATGVPTPGHDMHRIVLGQQERYGRILGPLFEELAAAGAERVGGPSTTERSSHGVSAIGKRSRSEAILGWRTSVSDPSSWPSSVAAFVVTPEHAFTVYVQPVLLVVVLEGP